LRLLILCLLLTALAAAAPGKPQGKPAFEVAETTYRRAAQKAFEYGNYLACDRLLQELLRLYEGLRDHPKLKSRADLRSQVQATIRQVEVWRVFVLGAARFYSDAIRLGRTLWEADELTPEVRLQAALGTILAAEASSQPTVTAALLEPASKLAREQKNKVAQFTLHTVEEYQRFGQRRLEHEEIWAGLAAAWQLLGDFKPQTNTEPIPTDALLFFHAEHWWNGVLLSFAEVADDARWDQRYNEESDRVEALVEKSRRTDWWLGYFNAWLGDVDFCLLVEDTAQARELLDYDEKLFVKPYFERTRQLDGAHRKQCQVDQHNIKALADTFRRDGMPVLDPKPLDFSLMAGSVSLIRARQLYTRARIILDECRDQPTSTQRAQLAKLLTEALALQRQGSQRNFMGNQDVRWVMLRAGLADMVTAKDS